MALFGMCLKEVKKKVALFRIIHSSQNNKNNLNNNDGTNSLNHETAVWWIILPLNSMYNEFLMTRFSFLCFLK